VTQREVHITVKDLTMAFGDFVVMHDLSFAIRRSDIFFIMGGSGGGKSTLFRHMIGLNEPAAGSVWYDDTNFTAASSDERDVLRRRFGILFQGSALWSAMTLAENVGLPLGEFTDLAPDDIREVAMLKLALVGLRGFEDHFPSEISGGMQKRAGLARAIALDPDMLFLDEPSAGLDPITSKLLDDLILSLRDSLGVTVVMVSHELPSIFGIGDDCIFLDTEVRTVSAQGNPRELLHHPPNENVHRFLTRGGNGRPEGATP
jgi:phospholipid/cholesterol/gamma-HCH transport system ATP-binding protein